MAYSLSLGSETHMIRLNAAFRADLEWWHMFMGDWNGVAMMSGEEGLSPGVEMWSGASGSWGCGAKRVNRVAPNSMA